jgi:ribonuclease R
MQDDMFELIETEYCLLGRRTGKKYTFGDNVKIKLKATNMEKRTIDFYLAEGSTDSSSKKRNIPQSRPSKSRGGRDKGKRRR